jgi:formylglycine-generating enzyme required for sulfatase activity
MKTVAVAAAWIALLSMQTIQVPPLDMEFIVIRPGSFQMGCSVGDKQCEDDEKPVQVRITKAFEIGKYEVTRAQWKAVMVTSPIDSTELNLPVGSLSWNDVQLFLSKLNARNDGYYYRLPTEAEWEYAARAGTTGRYPGNLNAMSWHGNLRGGRPHPVGEKKPNAWGIHDMIGNVSEWVQDWYGEFPPSGTLVDPTGPQGIQFGERVLRGASWGSADRYARVSHRGHARPDGRSDNFGFRCVREQSPPASSR